jgi:hypothetical protein
MAATSRISRESLALLKHQYHLIFIQTDRTFAR